MVLVAGGCHIVIALIILSAISIPNIITILSLWPKLNQSIWRYAADGAIMRRQ
jgi:hypothetical protein